MSNERYRHILDLLYGPIWHIQPSALQAMIGIVEMRVQGERLTADEIQDRIGGGRKSENGPKVAGGVAVMRIMGPIAHRMGMFDDISGGTSTERMGKDFDKLAADSGIGAIVLDIHSPGGMHWGLEEISDRIFNARRANRPIIAIANDLAASAAYWIASAADEVWVTPGGTIGSIGTLRVHQEASKMEEQDGVKTTLIASDPRKIEANTHEPLTGSAREHLQRGVDEAAGEFVAGVARNRGITAETVLANYGRGRVYGPAEAIRRGIADKIGTLDEVMASLGAGQAVAQGTGTNDSDATPAVHHTVANRAMRLKMREKIHKH